MALFDQVSKDIIAAMKAKDKTRLEALRNIKKVFIEAKTAPGANDTLDDAVALKLLQKLAKQGQDSAALYAGQNRQDLAAQSHLVSNGAHAHTERNEHAHRTKRTRAPFDTSQLTMASSMTFSHNLHDFQPLRRRACSWFEWRARTQRPTT